jgi:hypothetical protein
LKITCSFIPKYFSVYFLRARISSFITTFYNYLIFLSSSDILTLQYNLKLILTSISYTNTVLFLYEGQIAPLHAGSTPGSHSELSCLIS